MGTTKFKKGDGHIVFHVGKELPIEGSNMLIVPGIQNSQGRGVYFSDEPRLKYSGGEHFKSKLEVTPVFCIPMEGDWVRGKKHEKFGSEVSYHSDQKIIALFCVRYFEGEIEGIKVRYYYPKELSLFDEPDVKKNGRHVTSEFSSSILGGKLDFDLAVSKLRTQYQSTEKKLTEDFILQSMHNAIENGRIPKDKSVEDRLLELSYLKEGIMKMPHFARF